MDLASPADHIFQYSQDETDAGRSVLGYHAQPSFSEEDHLTAFMKKEDTAMDGSLQDYASEHYMQEESEVSQAQEPIPEGYARCEQCHFVGIKDEFYSKSKRFCKMECAKKYSALCQKKNRANAGNKDPLNAKKAAKRKVKLPPKTKKPKLELQREIAESSRGLPGEPLNNALLPTEFNLLKNLKLREPSTSTVDDQLDLSRGSWIDQEFNWNDYLKTTGDKPAPEHFSKHVMKSPTLNEMHVGMKVEVVNCGTDVPKDTETAYWVATILSVNGNMMLLRYEGYEDDSIADFWFDVRSKNIHPVGWCYSVQRLLIPPPAIKDRRTNWQQYLFKKLSGARTFSNEFLEKVQKGHYNRFEVGMKVEVPDKHNLFSMCVATIVDIVGDRLRLRYDGLDATVADDFWCHYLSSTIHPVGWSSLVGHNLQPPVGWKQSLTEWNEFLAEDLQNSRDAPQECFVQESMGTPPSSHGQFEAGMKFEAVDPTNPSQIVVATVVKPLRFNYFIIGVDAQHNYFICHANSKTIFPVGWCKLNKVQLTPPKDESCYEPVSSFKYAGRIFDWNKYLTKTSSRPVPPILFKTQEKRLNPFQSGMKVEAVDLREPSFICPATIVEVRGTLVRVHFDGWDSTFDQWCDFECLDLFPVGWCEKNNHPLQPPGSQMPDQILESIRLKQDLSPRTIDPSTVAVGSVSKVALSHPASPSPPPAPAPVKPPPAKVKAKKETEKGGKGKGGKGAAPIPKQIEQKGKTIDRSGNVEICFNQSCACGPFLNSEEVQKLPDVTSGALTGPPHQNCIRKCLHHIVNSALDPNQVLELFSKEFYQTKTHKDLKLDNVVCVEIIGKTGKRFLRRVRVPSKSTVLGKYLARVCQMLKCCPYFLSEERYPSGKCDTDCAGKFPGCYAAVPDSQTGDVEDPSGERFVKPLSIPRSGAEQRPNVDSPDGPSSSTVDRGFDPLNLFDQEFVRQKDPRTWSVMEVMDFLGAIGCQDHAPTFEKQEIDGKALLLLPPDALESLTENKLGPITKLKDALQSLKRMWSLHS